MTELGPLAKPFEAILKRLRARELGRRLWDRDPTLWGDAVATQRTVSSRLGWLELHATMRERLPELRKVAREVRHDGLRHAVVLGMGGSSLTAETLRRVFGVQRDHLDVRVLDTTDPGTIRAVTAAVPAGRTLFVVASKSGTTLEVDALHRHFEERASGPEQFIAITDRKSPLHRLALERGFRHVLLAPEDVGGRYSALSPFGLLPGALLGLDLERLLDGTETMASRCGADVPVDENPGLALGAVLAAAAGSGRDKMTLVLPSPLAPLGPWIEQLVAESSGKDGRGIVPVDGEPLATPGQQADDRLFVQVRLGTASDGAVSSRMATLAAAGQPVVTIDVPSVDDLGGEFLRWEIATAVACSELGVNAFDEPDVRLSKTFTSEVLDARSGSGRLPEGEPVAEEQGVRVFADPDLSPDVARPHLSDWLRAHLKRVRPGDYLALLAYVRRSDRLEYALREQRSRLRDRLGVATTVGYGPRYLHSTGQLHKGGPDEGLFLMVTRDARTDLEVPGADHGFATLQLAQAIGDFRALCRKKRRVLRMHLTEGQVSGFVKLRAALEEALLRLR